MRMRMRMGGFLAALVLSGAGLASAEDKVELKYRLEVGKTYHVRVRNDEKMAQELLGQKQDMDQTIGFEHALEPTAVDATGITAKVTFERVVFRQKGTMGNAEYDSQDASKDVPLLARGVAALAGRTFTVKLRPNGEIVEVAGLDALLEAALEQLPDDAVGVQMREGLKQQFSADAMKEKVGDMLVILPDEPVAVGASWSRRMELNNELGLVVEDTWTLKEVRARRAVIATATKVASDPNKMIEMGPVKARSSLKGELSGTVEIDLDTGLPVKGDAQGAIQGELTVTGGPDAKGGGQMTVPMTFEVRARVSGGGSKAESDANEKGKAAEKDAGTAE